MGIPAPPEVRLEALKETTELKPLHLRLRKLMIG
jgi:hypothetical protein